MRAPRLATAVGSSALLLTVLATSAGAQERSRQRAPLIRIYSENGAYAVQTTSYVEPAIEVAENAYVFAVSMDLDGHIQVLHPDAPGISVRMLAHKELRLPNFFAGYAGPGAGDQIYSSAGYSRYGGYGSGYTDSRGTIIALASRAPFNLDLIESGGDWNIATIRQLIEGRDPLGAASALANYVGAKGEPIGHDFLRFAGMGQGQYYAVDAYSSCSFYYGAGYASTLGLRGIQVFNQLHAARSLRGQRVRTLGYDACGVPIVVYAPGGTVAQRLLRGRVPRLPGDTTVFLKYRFSQGTKSGGQTGNAERVAPEGIFPLPRSGLSRTRDQTIIAPRGRRSEPRNVIEGSRAQPAPIAVSQGRTPVERPAPRSQPATGVLPAREYRPSTPPPPRAQPAVIITHEAPRAPPPRRR